MKLKIEYNTSRVSTIELPHIGFYQNKKLYEKIDLTKDAKHQLSVVNYVIEEFQSQTTPYENYVFVLLRVLPLHDAPPK